MAHAEPSPLAGQDVVVTLRNRVDDARAIGTVRVKVEDWWDRVAGRSWREMTGNPAALNYAGRIHSTVPADDEVLYVKLGGYGHLIHISEVVR